MTSWRVLTKCTFIQKDNCHFFIFLYYLLNTLHYKQSDSAHFAHDVTGQPFAHKGDITMTQSNVLPSDVTKCYIVNKSREV